MERRNSHALLLSESPDMPESADMLESGRAALVSKGCTSPVESIEETVSGWASSAAAAVKTDSTNLKQSIAAAVKGFNHPVQYKPEASIHGKSIALVGLDTSLEPESVRGVASLCRFFDKGHCAVVVIIPEKTSEPYSLDADVLESDNADLSILQQPHYHCCKGTCYTERLAALRNHLLDHIERMLPDTDYIGMIDFDNLVDWTAQTRSVILNAMTDKNVDKWDGVVFFADHYFDWWAARCSADSWNCKGHSSEYGMNVHPCHDEANFKCISDLDWQEDPDLFVPISSAFNGVGIYKLAAIGTCRYDNKNTDPTSSIAWDSEHVSFHTCLGNAGKKVMINAGRLNINPHNGHEADAVPWLETRAAEKH
jgi:hypothetical protein